MRIKPIYKKGFTGNTKCLLECPNGFVYNGIRVKVGSNVCEECNFFKRKTIFGTVVCGFNQKDFYDPAEK